jgi:hypothetical protein
MNNNKSTPEPRQNIVTFSFSNLDQEEKDLFKQFDEFIYKNRINRSEWIKSLVKRELQNQAQRA